MRLVSPRLWSRSSDSARRFGGGARAADRPSHRRRRQPLAHPVGLDARHRATTNGSSDAARSATARCSPLRDTGRLDVETERRADERRDGALEQAPQWKPRPDLGLRLDSKAGPFLVTLENIGPAAAVESVQLEAAGQMLQPDLSRRNLLSRVTWWSCGSASRPAALGKRATARSSQSS
jgi:hypothetical protein